MKRVHFTDVQMHGGASPSLADTAGDWLIRRHEGLTAQEETRFRAWLGADARHAEVFAELERTWCELNHPRRSGLAGMALDRLGQRRRRRVWRRGVYTLGAVSMVVASLFVSGIWPSPAPERAPRIAPVIAVSPDRQVLPDGSIVERNAGGDMEVDFSPGLRRVRLLHGEMIFTVAKDPARPFVVIAGGVEVRAIGTEFAVRFDPAAIDVLVIEGQVVVERTSGAARTAAHVGAIDPLVLEMGRRVSVPAAAIDTRLIPVQVTTPAYLAQALAWRENRIEFSATRLSDVLAVFNARNELQLVASDPAVAQAEISGIFWADDPESFVRLIETALGVKVDRSGKNLVLQRK